MTSIHHIDNTPPESTFTENNVAAANQAYLAPDSINEALLSELLHHGAQVSPTKALPELPRAAVDYTQIENEDLVAVPSMGATMMQAIVSMASLMRRQNAELRGQEINAMAAEMDTQATTLRSKARTLYWNGILAGLTNIAAGVVTFGIGAKMSTKLCSTTEAEFSALTQKYGSLSTGVNAMGGGVSTTLQSYGQSNAVELDAAIRNSEAAVERTRARMEFMKSLEESMREVINKAIATQDAIQQNTNQTRSKILG